MSDDIFSLKPTSQEDMDDLAKRGIDWIKDRIARAENHIQNVHDIRTLATQEELNAEDYYAMLAYRVLVELVDISTMAERQCRAANDPLLVTPEGQVLSSLDNDDGPKIIT